MYLGTLRQYFHAQDTTLDAYLGRNASKSRWYFSIFS
jgi:hypothetical protein